MAGGRRAHVVAAAATALAVVVVAALAWRPSLAGVFYDDGIYLALARALREGEGYRLLYLPGAPPGVHYPPGFPVWLAAAWSAVPDFPAVVPWLRGLNVALLALACGLTVRYLGPRLALAPWPTALAVGLAAMTVPVIALATVLFAEPLFLVLAVLACWAADRARGSAGRTLWGLAAAAGLLAGAAGLTRTIGIAVVAGVVVSLATARRFGPAVLAAALAGACLVPWFAWSAAHAGAVDHVLVANYGTYGQFAAQSGPWWTPAALRGVVQPLAAVALPAIPGVWVVAAALAAPLLVWGALVAARGAPALAVSIAAYLGLVAAWPYEPSRFLWAVLPFLAVWFAAGVRAAYQRAGARPAARLLVVVAAGCVAGGTAIRAATGHARGAAGAAQEAISGTMQAVVDWAQTLDTAAVVAVEDEALVWLYSGRRAVPSYLWKVRGRGGDSFGADTLRAWLDRAGATHLVLTGPNADAAPDVDALLQRAPGYLRLVRVWPGQMLGFAIARSP